MKLNEETTQPQKDCVAVTPAKPGPLLRLPATKVRVQLGTSSIYAGVKNKTFPAPVRLSARAVAWRSEDIDLWIAERVQVGAA